MDLEDSSFQSSPSVQGGGLNMRQSSPSVQGGGLNMRQSSPSVQGGGLNIRNLGFLEHQTEYIDINDSGTIQWIFNRLP